MPVWRANLLTLVDDRGTKFSVKPKETAVVVGMDKSTKKALKAWWRRNRRRFFASIWRGQLTVLAGVALFFLIFFNPGGFSAVQFVGGLLALGFMGLGLSLTIKGGYQVSMNAFAAVGRCGLCGYILRGLQAEGDGCTVCPECAAAWRLPERTEALGEGDEVTKS